MSERGRAAAPPRLPVPAECPGQAGGSPAAPPHPPSIAQGFPVQQMLSHRLYARQPPTAGRAVLPTGSRSQPPAGRPQALRGERHEIWGGGSGAVKRRPERRGLSPPRPQTLSPSAPWRPRRGQHPAPAGRWEPLPRGFCSLEWNKAGAQPLERAQARARSLSAAYFNGK